MAGGYAVGERGEKAAVAMNIGALVLYGAAGLVLCGAGQFPDGINMVDKIQIGDTTRFLPIEIQSQFKLRLSGACAAGDPLYAAANGEVSTVAIGEMVAIAREAGGVGGLVTAWVLSRSAVWRPNAVAKTAAYSAGYGDFIVCDPTGGAFPINLPLAVVGGKPIIVKNGTASLNAITITRAGADTIEGGNTLVMNTARKGYMLVPGNGIWYAVNV